MVTVNVPSTVFVELKSFMSTGAPGANIVEARFLFGAISHVRS